MEVQGRRNVQFFTVLAAIILLTLSSHRRYTKSFAENEERGRFHNEELDFLNLEEEKLIVDRIHAEDDDDIETVGGDGGAKDGENTNDKKESVTLGKGQGSSSSTTSSNSNSYIKAGKHEKVFIHDDDDHSTDNKEDDDDNNDDNTNTPSHNEQQNPEPISNTETTTEPKPKPKRNTKPEPMNILILYPDDWRHDSIGSVHPHVHTPYLNSLSSQGIRFSQNAVTTSVCWMSRATLFTGQYSSSHLSYRPRCPHFVRKESWRYSWPFELRNRGGYYVGHVGKWQYVNRNPSTYDLFDWTNLFEGDHYFTRRGEGGRRTVKRESWHWFEERNATEIHASTMAEMAAIDFLEGRPKDRPFAMTVAFYPPKTLGKSRLEPTGSSRERYGNVTLEVPEMKESFKKLPKFLQEGRMEARSRMRDRYYTEEEYQTYMKDYYALITDVDEACKNIVKKLKEDGLYDNTMIIFTTDNGMFHGAHGLADKWYPYQESIRVPLIVYDPRMPVEKRGTVDDSFTLNIDLASTILGAAGIKPNTKMEGRDISDLYLKDNEKDERHRTASVEKQPWRDEFFYEFPYDDIYLPSSTALVRKDYKYIHWPEHGVEELFHLGDDPLEFHDLVKDGNVTDVLNEMRERHDRLRDEVQQPKKKKLVCGKDQYN